MKVAAVVLLALVLAPQDQKRCDVARTQIRDYCPGCRAWPSTEQMEKGGCKKCRSKIEKIETCIKSYWDCPKAHDKPARHSKKCDAAPGCCKEVPSLAIVSYVCDKCNRTARKEADVKHGSDKCEGKIKKDCSLSGTFPHGGTEE